MEFRSDIGLFRVIVIFFLVVFHSFCPYGGHWGDVGVNVPFYYWLDNWSYSFFLQGFIFISGFLYGIQLPKKKAYGQFSINYEIKRKFMRLMVPSLIFSCLYVVLFNKYEGWLTPYRIINGVGHLWFLPTLFSCFICVLLIDKYNISPKIVIPLFILLSLIPLPGLPMRVDLVCKYFIFFYLGFIGWGTAWIDIIPKWGILLLSFFQVFIFFVLYKIVISNEVLMGEFGFLPRLFELIYSSIGVFVVFALSQMIVNIITSPSIIKIIDVANSYSFGIYISTIYTLVFVFLHYLALHSFPICTTLAFLRDNYCGVFCSYLFLKKNKVSE